jgi:transcriptional regulator with XRE-family HTH domain
MFYDRFKQLCDEKGISCNKAALEIGLSNATPTKWKKTGATPGGKTLDKIAAYFNVSVDYLLTGQMPSRRVRSIVKVRRKTTKKSPAVKPGR